MLNVIVRFADLPEQVRTAWVAARLQGEQAEVSYLASTVAQTVQLHGEYRGRILRLYPDGTAHVIVDVPVVPVV